MPDRVAVSSMLRRERLLQALRPESIRLDDRDAVDLLQRLNGLARHIRFPTGTPSEDGNWAPMLDSDICFLLAEMASTDPVQEFFDAQETTDSMLLRTVARLKDWRQRAARLATALELNGGGARALAGSHAAVANAVHVGMDRILERELEWMDAVESAETAPNDPSHDANRVTTQRRFLEANRVTRLIASHARDHLATLLAGTAGDHPPHVALLLVAIQLMLDAKAHLNELASRHLDFYYRRVLQLAPRAATADEAWVSVRLAAATPGIRLAKGEHLSAGLDTDGSEVLYALTEDLHVGHSRVDAVRAMHVQRERGPTGEYRASASINAIIAAPIANSADGRGGALEPGMGWAMFGAQRDDLSVASGLIIRSSVFSMREGERQIELSLTFEERNGRSAADVLAQLRRFVAQEREGPVSTEILHRTVAESLCIEVSTPQGYERVGAVDAEFATQPNRLLLRFSRSPVDSPMAAVGKPQQGSTDLPSVRIRLDPTARIRGFSWATAIVISDIRVRVRVRGVQLLQLQGPQGPIPLGKPFPIFGVQPQHGATLSFTSEELWHKALSEVRVHVQWSNLPETAADFSARYADYGDDYSPSRYRLAFHVLDGHRWQPLSARLSSQAAATAQVACFPEPDVWGVHAMSTYTLALHGRTFSARGVKPQAPITYTPDAADGFFRIELVEPRQAFGHAAYPTLLAVAASRMLPWRRRALHRLLASPPFTPMVERFTLDYQASDQFAVNALTTVGGQARPHVELLDAFGHVRPVSQASTGIVNVGRAGSLFLGLVDAKPEERLTLLFRIHEPAGDGWSDRINTTPQGRHHVMWRVLTANGWSTLPVGSILADDTRGLRRTGIVRLVLPSELERVCWGDAVPRVWIELSVADDPTAYGRVTEIQTYAARVHRVATGTNPTVRTPANGIKRLQTPRAQVAALVQPEPSFGGVAAETDEAFYTRVSERLRHKQRAVTPRDFESIVLERFSSLAEVKCVRAGGGRVVVVVVPEVPAGVRRNYPTVPPTVCEDIAQYLRSVAARSVREIFVRSPWFEHLRVSTFVRFQPGRRLEGMQALHTAIESYLSPWRTATQLRLGIGAGSVTVSELRSHLESMRSSIGIERLDGFSLTHHFRAVTSDLRAGDHEIVDSARTDSGSAAHRFVSQTPWSVLVPASQHVVRELDTPEGIGTLSVGDMLSVHSPSQGSDALLCETPAGIGNLRVGKSLVLPFARDEERARET